MSTETKAQIWGGEPWAQEIPGATTVQLQIGQSTVQVSAHPDGNGFMIRAWAHGQLHEFGGGNGNALGSHILIDPTTLDMSLDEIEFRTQWAHARHDLAPVTLTAGLPCSMCGVPVISGTHYCTTSVSTSPATSVASTPERES